jgi:surface antigen
VEAPGSNHFAYGYCTWYVANRRNVPWFGNAKEWWGNAPPYGYAEGQAPIVGAIMVTRESGWGHVAYVESVNGDGSWTVSEMNFKGWNIVSRRTLRPGQAPVVGFIYGRR